jgi:hypothetical protein
MKRREKQEKKETGIFAAFSAGECGAGLPATPCLRAGS